MKEFWDPDDADYPPLFKDAIEALRRDREEREDYVVVVPKGTDPEADQQAKLMEDILNKHIATNPGAKAAYDQAMADAREKFKRLLLYGHT